jgi:hypothetical protein
VSARDDLEVIDPAPQGAVTLGDGAAAVRVIVKPMRVGQLPAFARALRPISSEIDRIMVDGMSVDSVLALIEGNFESAIEALHAATGAAHDAIRDATLDQALELFLAVLSANKDFLRGRLATALKTAAAVSPGAGRTP